MQGGSHQQHMVALLRELRDNQRAMLEQVSAQRVLIEEQVKRSRESIAEWISLQKIAIKRTGDHAVRHGWDRRLRRGDPPSRDQLLVAVLWRGSLVGFRIDGRQILKALQRVV